MATLPRNTINLAVGWPNPKLLATKKNAKSRLQRLPAANIQEWGCTLGYDIDEGSDTLRGCIAEWLSAFYRPQVPISPQRICIAGGASQNLAWLLQTLTDPVYTWNIWMVVPTYICAIRILDESGFTERLRGVPEMQAGLSMRTDELRDGLLASMLT